MNKKFGYNEDGTMKTWLAVSFSLLVVILAIGGLLRIFVDNPPSEKILSKPYASVMGHTLSLDDSLHWASYGFTKDASLSGMAKFRDVDLDWKKIDASKLPKEIKSQLRQADVDLVVYVADVDESLANGVTDVKHYVILRHFHENNTEQLRYVFTVVKIKNSEPKVYDLEDSVNFTTAYLVTRGK
nr:MAG TPA: hypothetical protein [Caudoviricetes sp.]